MRKRIWIPCAVLFAVCLLLLVEIKQDRKVAVPEPVVALTNQVGHREQPPVPAPKSLQAPGRIVNTPTPVSATGRPPLLTTTNPFFERILPAWQKPIEFYGKVVDEHTNPVLGANVSFAWSETPEKAGEMTATTQSDRDGLFSLRGKHGPSLEVWVSKEGYYASHRGQWGFSYSHGDFSPDPQNPVIFTLRKKGTPAAGLLQVKRNERIARDGTPVSFNLATGSASTGESGNLVVRCWTQDQGKRSGEKYDWRCALNVPNGGLVLTNEEFAFLAPESGYEPSVEIKMPADRPDWTSQVDLKFYYRLADGRYGRMTFSMIAGGQHFCMIDSLLNPSGSRNLEPDH